MNQKKKLRKQITQLKQNYTIESLRELSKEVIELLKKEEVFDTANMVLLYHSLPDEVYTHQLIEELTHTKTIVLPVVVNDILELRSYKGKEDLKLGSYNIWEPTGEVFTNYDEIDVVIVPGVGFDSIGNRIGRGKGYYDKLLPKIAAKKLGICFPFQYLTKERIPTEPHDIPMDKIITIK